MLSYSSGYASHVRKEKHPMMDGHLTSEMTKQHLGVSINGATPKWLVYLGNPIEKDDLGVPLFQETSM